MFRKKDRIDQPKKRRWPKVAAFVAAGAAAASGLFIFTQKKNTSK